MSRLIHCCKQNSIQLRRISALSFCNNTTIYSRDNKDKVQLSFVANSQHKQITINHGCRNYSNKNERDSKAGREFPRFVDKFVNPPRVFVFPLIYWFVKNTMDADRLRNLYDPDFNKNDFLEGSKKAIEVVFQKLANGRYDDLNGMVENDLLQKLKAYFSQLPDEKRKKFEFDNKSHTVTQFDKITIQTEENRVFAHIEMRHLVIAHKMDKLTTNLEDVLAELKGSIEIPLLLINTMFTKECTKGVDDDWAVSGLNFDWSSDIKKSLSS